MSYRSLLISLLLSCSLCVQAKIVETTVKPQQLHAGSACLFTVVVNDGTTTAVSGTWLGKDLTFFKSRQPRIWYALAGVDLETKPGAYDLKLTATKPDQSVSESVRTIQIGPSHYKTISLKVPQEFTNPTAEMQQEIETFKKTKQEVFDQRSDTELWSGKFVKPIKSAATGSFGVTRVLNGQVTSVHRGTDFPAKTGTPVRASNSGTVVLAQKLFYEGNCVMIDHGQQFLTIYMHLSKILVNKGDRVEKGERIGLSGSTGQSSGPHLHMGVRWQNSYLDPVTLLSLPLPVTKPAVHTKGTSH